MSHEVNWLKRKKKKHINCIKQKDLNSNEIKTIFLNTRLFMYHKHHFLSLQCIRLTSHANFVDSKGCVLAFKGIRWHFWSWLTWTDKVQSSETEMRNVMRPMFFPLWSCQWFEFERSPQFLARCPQFLFKEINTTPARHLSLSLFLCLALSLSLSSQSHLAPGETL